MRRRGELDAHLKVLTVFSKLLTGPTHLLKKNLEDLVEEDAARVSDAGRAVRRCISARAGVPESVREGECDQREIGKCRFPVPITGIIV